MHAAIVFQDLPFGLRREQWDDKAYSLDSLRVMYTRVLGINNLSDWLCRLLQL